MRKIIVRLMMVLTIGTIISGCGKETSKEASESGLTLESYVNDEKENEYLEDVSFKNEKEFVKLPVLINSTATDEKEATGSNAGVSLRVKMHSAENNSLGTLMSKTYQQEKEDIEKDGGKVSSDPVYIEGDNYYILQQSFTKTVDDLEYPCLLIIKFDTLSMGGFVETTIVTDNTATDETSHAVLEEILDAYNISLESEES